MAYKAPGAPCDLLREHILLNASSFSATANTDSGDFRTDAITEGWPARQTHVHDATAWAVQPKSDSWSVRLRGAASNANLTQEVQGGQLT